MGELSSHDSALHVFGSEGELVLLRIRIDPKSLEELLDVLAGLAFPVNPELYHGRGYVVVEFPAYERHIEEVKAALVSSGLDVPVQASGVLASAAGA